MTTVLNVVGARPNFMKIGPVLRALKAKGMAAPLLHTGQHYDAAMNDRIFADLGLPEPDVNLEVGSGSHARQTADVMTRFEPVLDEMKPDAVLVVGDVNSTIACALVAAKKGVRVIHVEAGLRSYDRAMPEEVNRVLTDQISDFLFTTEREAEANLVREGIDPARVFFVGNVMIDSLLFSLDKAVPAAATLGGLAGGYTLVTLHRPSNVDVPGVLGPLVECLIEMAAAAPVIFPCHPRTRARLEAAGLLAGIEAAGIRLLPPQGYLEMLGLMRGARVVVTDSGGLQEETTALGVPCVTVRENTERPITITHGTNTLVGTDPARVMAAFRDVLATGGKAGRIPELWDGHAAERIAAVLAERL
ncbi:non-hydrolyzing UDP-N-acetylglucosamine 2-epimerase [Magnetospirillum sp. UT-4]|uniref:non-hydrolyzing UDP-N-acetylglucosamine 2-epimerase n=1 Tax=Magnetospirillum sp. UT-4 TaxID=2681467 RepID=UPI001383CEF1|nr:UDP-N-acetylglucosamine 2-epimerase (non-hydrolyzing) [Magnetospirillum sp. UT-4]CAA7612167.1 UDP-N-acetylglucosamine 2-epimerase [Magnetospirillum sp. UT-4]